MSFTYLVNSTPAIAEIVNENFYHIGNGDLMPMGGSTLSYYNNVYTLGNSTSNWANLFFETIKTCTTSKMLKHEQTVTLIGETSTISFVGVTNFRRCKIVCTFKFANIEGQRIEMRFNNDSSSSYNMGYYNTFVYWPLMRNGADAAYLLQTFQSAASFLNYNVDIECFKQQTLQTASLTNLSFFWNFSGDITSRQIDTLSALYPFGSGFGIYYKSSLSVDSISFVANTSQGTTTSLSTLFSTGTTISLYTIGEL